MQPIKLDEIEDFARTLGPEFLKEVSRLRELAERKLLELRPILLILVLLYMQRQKGDRQDASSLFELLNKVISELLADPDDRKVPQVGRVKSMTREDVRDLRLAVLTKMVEKWKVSIEPCRIPHGDMKTYVEKELRTITRKKRNLTVEEMSVLIPTGICLELIERDETFYGFVHNSIQEFLYARLLLAAIRNGNDTPFGQDYYSAEIMELLGQAVNADDIKTVLAWVSRAKLTPMVRKVGAGLLGFVQDSDVDVKNYLSDEFEKPDQDGGVAGRIAEALRRHGDDTAFLKFIDILDDYPPRKAVFTNEELKPLTFEIREPLKLSKEIQNQIRRKLYSYVQSRPGGDLTRSDKPSTRKHALIILMRMEPRLARGMVVDYCLREIEHIENDPEYSGAALRVAAVRSIRYGVEALRWYGSDIEKAFVSHVLQRLEGLEDHSIAPETRNHLEETAQELERGNWLHEGVLTKKDRQDARPFFFYVARHAESKANRQGSVVGVGPDHGALSERGEEQASRLAEKLASEAVDEILLVTSPYKRAADTAQRVADRLRVEAQTENRFHELDYGAWTGHDLKEVAVKYKNGYARWRKDPRRNRPNDGESMFTVRSRVFEALGYWAARAIKEEKVLVVITHYFPLVAIHEELESDADAPRNCSLSRFELKSKRVIPSYTATDGYLEDYRSPAVEWP